jgi:hypothetical protein
MKLRIFIDGPNGKRELVVEEGQSYQTAPGELVIDAMPANPTLEAEFEHELRQAGVQWGDLLAKATHAFGIAPCAPCEQRRQILNQAKELGIREVIKRIKETF